MKSGNLNFLEPSGPLRVCNGTAFIHCRAAFRIGFRIVLWKLVIDDNINCRFLVGMTKEVTKWRPKGRRKRGRPTLTWAEGIRGLIGEKGLIEEDWNDRGNWRKKIL